MEDLEAWMKLVASSSYDYLKLMIAELQHQLAELEEVDQQRQQQHQGGEGGEGAPCPPPRTRANPFNKSYGLRDRSWKQTWAECHNYTGQKILRDRKTWAETVSGAGVVETTVKMVGDNLLAMSISSNPPMDRNKQNIQRENLIDLEYCRVKIPKSNNK